MSPRPPQTLSPQTVRLAALVKAPGYFPSDHKRAEWADGFLSVVEALADGTLHACPRCGRTDAPGGGENNYYRCAACRGWNCVVCHAGVMSRAGLKYCTACARSCGYCAWANGGCGACKDDPGIELTREGRLALGRPPRLVEI